MRGRFRLAHKLIVLVTVTAGVAVLVPSLLVIRYVAGELKQDAAAITQAGAREGSLRVELSLQSNIRDALDLADDLERIGGDAAQREAAIRRWLERQPGAREVCLVADEPGASWQCVRDEPTRRERIELRPQHGDLAQYRGVRVGVEHLVDDHNVLTIATDRIDRLDGTLVFRFRLGHYVNLLREIVIGRSGYAFVVDGRGHVLAHPHYVPAAGGPTSGPAYALPGTDLSGLELIADSLTPEPDEQRQLIYQSESEGGEAVVAGSVRIGGLGWAVIAEQPRNEALASVEAMKEQVVLWGSTTALVAILLGLAIVGQITKPLETLADAANRVGAGDLTHPVGVATSDEIGQLALSFNEMQVRLREMYDKLERMVAERTHELQETTDFLNSVFDSSTEYSIIATDLQGRILSYNEGSRQVYGYEPEEIIGAPISLLIPRTPEEEARNGEILDHVRREGTWSGEVPRLRKGGREFPVRLVLSVRYDDAGNPAGYTSISRDITTRKEMEAKLREYTENLEALVASKTHELQEANVELSRANQLKADFLASMSHELRTPLNAIIGFADVLAEEVSGPLNGEQRDYVDDIRRSGRQLLNLINDILDLSKVDAGAMQLDAEDVFLEEVFSETQTIIQGMAVRKRLSLAFREEPAGIVLRADRVKLLQILYNLLSNAVKFTPEAGSVRVEASDEGEQVVFRVVDNGVGIPPDSLDVIFEEFRQVDSRLNREFGGTGLGLALTRKLVTLHGGTLAVESEVDRGSTFIFTIPRRLPGDDQQSPGTDEHSATEN